MVDRITPSSADPASAYRNSEYYEVNENYQSAETERPDDVDSVNISPDAREVAEADSYDIEKSSEISEADKVLMGSAWYSQGVEAAYSAREDIEGY